MRCFFPFKDKFKRQESWIRSAPTTRPVSPVSIRSHRSSPIKQISKSAGSSSSPRSIPALYEEKSHNLRVFDIKEVRQATNDFSRLLKIGEGGFGSVYKGLIGTANGRGDRITVAIKKLNQNGKQGHKQWLAEVLFLGVVEHPNLVKLVGYCAVDADRGMHRSLVYEYMPNKSLEEHLFNKAYPVLPWLTRLEIALGAAEGLSYLHEGLEIPVIYRDFKASNVLLDNDFKPKLSDFGLAREGPSEGRTHVTTAVVGTYGYAAPDYIETGKLTVKSDVWSFGVVLYEIITGRRSLERFRPRPEQKLLEWVRQFPVESRRFYMIIDPRLRAHYSLAATKMLAGLANRCLVKNRNERPVMREVIAGLRQAIQATEMDDGSPMAALSDGERSSTDSENDHAGEQQVLPVESSRRRMEHLAKMTENLSLENKMRFMALQGADNS